jgi:hypothetical protein
MVVRNFVLKSLYELEFEQLYTVKKFEENQGKFFLRQDKITLFHKFSTNFNFFFSERTLNSFIFKFLHFQKKKQNDLFFHNYLLSNVDNLSFTVNCVFEHLYKMRFQFYNILLSKSGQSTPLGGEGAYRN